MKWKREGNMQNSDETDKKSKSNDTFFKKEIGTYIFVPLYNVCIDPNILGKDFHTFDIISTTQFFNEYSSKFQQYGFHYQTLQLEWNLQQHLGYLEKYPVANFLIRTGGKLPHIVDQKTNDYAQGIINKGLNAVVNYLMAMRLYKSGNIQIERYYVISPEMSGTGFLAESTVKEYIDLKDNYSDERWNEYKIAETDVPKIITLCKKMNSVIDIINIPITYFQEYYSSKNTFDKLLKLITVWECTLLNDCRSELTYKLQVRGSNLLSEDLSKFFKIAYELRSDIIHTGKPSDKIEKQLRKFLNTTNDKSLSDMLVIFVRDYMEPITRRILLRFVDKAVETHQNLEQIAQSIDSEVFNIFNQK